MLMVPVYSMLIHAATSADVQYILLFIKLHHLMWINSLCNFIETLSIPIYLVLFVLGMI